MAAVYGNVFSMRLGRDKTVFVSGYKAVREALVTQAHVFVERPYSPMATRLYSDSMGGFFFSNGPVWRTQRRFAMATLRRLGLGSCLENIIWEEIRHLQLEMEDRIGEPFNPTHLFNNAVANIICQMVFGRRFEYEDQHFQTMLKNLIELAHLEGSIWAHV
ncbi:hypothetical protein CRUP_020817 [Coryphaenoides rupestris]|nr:hypothetical protein CRUP_020817 [Coryphaenoides rupestris]